MNMLSTNPISRLDNHRLAPFPWLRKKSSNWSLRSISKSNNQRLGSFSSTLSLPLSTASTLSASSIEQEEPSPTQVIIPEEEEEEEEEEEADHSPTPTRNPPAYDDPTHPWVFQFPKSLSDRIIIPREEEGHEVLPEYSCTVDRMTFMHVKCEFIKPKVRSSNRSWKDYYVVVYGTKIMAYHRNPKHKKNAQPAWTYSMQDAEVSAASDYVKFRHVIRLKIHQGPQFLLTTQNDLEKVDWMGVLESSIFISSDLDVRTMPQFITLIRRRRRRQQRDVDCLEQRETLV